MKAPFNVYADLEYLLKTILSCQNNPEKSYTTKINKRTPSGYTMFTHCSFDATKKKWSTVIEVQTA